MGGRSTERNVSLASGQQVVKNLNPKKFNIYPTVISKDGRYWRYFPVEQFLFPLDIFSKNADENLQGNKSQILDLNKLKNEKIDVVFIAMHGPDGEDGKIQGLLEILGLKYTGSGVLASSIGMDKKMFRNLMNSSNIPVPKYMEVNKNSQIKDIKKVLGNPPYFVKPSNQGSSVGMNIVDKENDLKKAINEALKYSDTVLVDKYIKAREFTCSIIGNEIQQSLPIVEIIPKKSRFFDFLSKYSIGGADEIVPAEIPAALSNKIKSLAQTVYRLVGCKGFARVDFLVKNSKVYVLEINTIPGLTSTSLFPKAALAAGISYSALLEKIIKLSLE